MFKAALLTVALALSVLPALAGNGQGQNNNNQGQNQGGGGVHGAPAPVIGGLPVALGVGGVWIARKLWQKRRR